MGTIRKLHIFIFAAAAILVLAVTFFLQAMTTYSSQVIVAEADGAIGMAPFTDRIDFGDVPQGATISKTLILENQGTAPNHIKVFMIGGIGDLVEIEPTSLTVEPGETVEVNFRLTMPASATPEKKFTGRVFVLRLPGSIW